MKCAIGLGLVALLCVAAPVAAQQPITAAPPAPPVAPAPAPTSGWGWLNPLSWPFLPVPLVASDPNSGVTVGLLPTWLETNAQHEIDRIIAPDVQYNPYFGYGAHGRVLEFPSPDVQWSVEAGLNERVQRSVDLEFEKGLLREHRWSYNLSMIYERDGTPRFYGIGNGTNEYAATNYTTNGELVLAQLGVNLSQALQVQYTFRFQSVDVLPGTLPGIPSIQQLYAGELGTTHEILDRVSVAYDTRDSITVPSTGMRWVVYTGLATHSSFGELAYSEAGVDGSMYWPVGSDTVLASHVALRYLPTLDSAAFWELSTLGGGDSVIGAEQPLRGFGEGRFTGRNSFSFTTEMRQRILDFGLFNTELELELAPFMDLGRVFNTVGTFPLSQLHKVFGLGFRGIARPFIVGHVDVGYGSEGAAVFTGIAYPF
ncbi:MAG TPA: BamA/TamA family outer membrane protein [Steroidobacteraceae bacterium]|nr:BamA/TamA family outer membrane protein [Steroidobacteraceae bacterium]